LLTPKDRRHRGGKSQDWKKGAEYKKEQVRTNSHDLTLADHSGEAFAICTIVQDGCKEIGNVSRIKWLRSKGGVCLKYPGLVLGDPVL
jgi:hypothetical protein